VSAVGLEAITAHEQDLLRYASEQLARIPGLRLIGTAREKAAVVSFVLEGVHAHDVGTILDQHGIAVRTGHHCAQPVMERYGVPATVRASFALYNTRADVDALVRGLGQVRKVFA
jgi:cysteine desulfurase/selenocysteine lyase